MYSNHPDTSNGLKRHAAALCCFFLFLVGNGVAGAEYNLTVSSCRLDNKLDSRGAKNFAYRVGCLDDFNVRAVPNGTWYQVPEGVEARHHVNLVTVRIGKRYDFLAFMFGGEKNSVSYVARAPALDQEPPTYWFRASPGDHEIAGNAGVDLMGNFSCGLPGWTAAGPIVQVKIMPWPETAGQAMDGIASEAMFKIDANETDRLLPLFVAAAAGNGLRPTFEEVDGELRVKVRKRPDSYDFKVTLSAGGRRSEHIHVGVLRENVYEEAGMICRVLTTWAGKVKGFSRLTDTGLTPLATSTREQAGDLENILVATNHTGLAAYGAQSLEPLWALKGRVFAPFRQHDDTSVSLIVNKHGLGVVDLEKGKVSHCSDVAPKHPWAVSIDGAVCATAHDRRLSVHVHGREKWTFDSDTPLTAGPMLSARTVFVGSAAAELIALDRSSGSETFVRPLPVPLYGYLTEVGDHLVGTAVDGTMYALSTSDGKVIWQRQLGDVLLQKPLVLDEVILAVSKTNTMFLLAVDSGKVKAERSWPTWITAFALINGVTGKRLAIIDIQNRLTLLTLPTFEIVDSIEFPHPLSKVLAATPDFSASWKGGGGLAERGPAYLLGDVKGHLFILNAAWVNGMRGGK